MSKTSTKYNARLIAAAFKFYGCTRVVIAPGSRNAPLINAFAADEAFELISAPDERAAAFIAMGLTLNGKPAAVCSSSGSAVVNFYPAISEAYYQKLPLIVLTADRPIEGIDQGVGQTIRQQNVFANHINGSANLVREPHDELSKRFNQRLVSEAFLSLPGPIHINVPFDEPLYDTTSNVSDNFTFIQGFANSNALSDASFNVLKCLWEQSPKKLVLAGQMNIDHKLVKTLNQLDEVTPFITFSETVSNMANGGHNIKNIDRLINTLNDDGKRDLQPDLLITIGGDVVSKMVKKYLKQYPATNHIHFGDEVKDTFGYQSQLIKEEPAVVLEKLAEELAPDHNNYADRFTKMHQVKAQAQKEFIKQAPFSDLKAFETILPHLPEGTLFHTANSTSVRYSQLFDHADHLVHYANRGTSGIDGCTSTAVGHALATQQPVTLITGDIAFFYDNNAFWVNPMPDNLKVIVLNNSGGNIFRVIQGPDVEDRSFAFQETVHQQKAEHVAQRYGLPYYKAENEVDLQQALKAFYGSTQTAILEIFTPQVESPEVLKAYFAHLRKHA